MKGLSPIFCFLNPRSPRGFTILFATLVAGLLLAVGFTIFDITFKEEAFSSVVRNSDTAIYAADAGYECAQYWDVNATGGKQIWDSRSVFATSTNSQNAPSVSGIACGGTTDITTSPPALLPPTLPFSEDTQDTQTASVPPDCPSATRWCVRANATAATTTFEVTFPPHSYCAVVQVIKYGPVDSPNTIYLSRGYNTCDTNDPSRVERVLETL